MLPKGRRPVIGVLGSGTEAQKELAAPLGRWLATQAVHLLTGGGGGVMEAVSSAFASVPTRLGSIIGIVPGDEAGMPPEGYPSPWVELAIQTHLPLTGDRGTEPMSRNHIVVLSSQILVALPGGAGTASELELCLVYDRPVIAYFGPRGSMDGVPDAVPIARTLSEVEDFLRPRLGAIRKRQTVESPIVPPSAPPKSVP